MQNNTRETTPLFGTAQECLELNTGWTVSWDGQAIPATVPGYAQQDMYMQGLLPDPFYGTNEKQWKESFSRDYTWRCRFTVPETMVARTHFELVLEGVDTIADITLNDTCLGRTDSMFRGFRFDIRDTVQTGENTLEITIYSPEQFLNNARENCDEAVQVPPRQTEARELLRKEQCSFGWDWGIYLPCSGIWKPVRIEAWDDTRIGGISVDTDVLDQNTRAVVTGWVTLDSCPSAGTSVRLSLEGPVGERIDSEKELQIEMDSVPFKFEIENPEIWWPNGLGGQPLYTLNVELVYAGQSISEYSRRIGIRKLAVVQEPDEYGAGFYFTVNGVPLFAKGANWIPADALLTRLDETRYRQLLESARDAHMNMLRVWGGGIYEQNMFYDICDELGLLVWQDLMFACGIYPVDHTFLKTVGAEVKYQVKRLQTHPCIALWCGNNECEELARGWIKPENVPATAAQHEFLFDWFLRGVVSSIDSGRLYWPSTSHSPFSAVPKRQDCGDTHFWEVWHGNKLFEAYLERTDRFMSEFGYQSFPDMHTICAFAADDQLALNSPVMKHHQRCYEDGNQRMMNRITERWGTPASFDDFVCLSQLQQAEAIRMGVEHWRRNRNGNHCMGTLYWQLNDCWPVISWSSIDYYGRWKALQYAARRFFAQQLISMNKTNDTISITVINDGMEAYETDIHFTIGRYSGETVAEKSMTIHVPATSALQVCSVPVKELIGDTDPAELYLAAEMASGRDGSRSILHFTSLAKARLDDPALCLMVEGSRVTVSAQCFAKSVVLECKNSEVQFSDNYFDLLPGAHRTVNIVPLNPGNPVPEIMANDVKVKSFRDMIKNIM